MKMTIEELEALNPCAEAMEYVHKHKTLHVAWEKCDRADWMIWFLRRKNLLEQPVAVKFACLCAERLLPLFEKKYPDDKRPHAAIEAALKWLKDPTEANRAAAYAAAAYAERNSERQWQAAELRKLVPNPFTRASRRPAKQQEKPE